MLERLVIAIESIASSLAVLAKTGALSAEATAALGTPDTKKNKKADAPPAAAPTPAATPAPAPAAAATPAPAPAAAPDAATGPAWSDVLSKITELNKGTQPGQGRDGILDMLNAFIPGSVTTGADGVRATTTKVPALEALKRHAEVLAWVNQRLASPAAASGSDLGL